MKEESVDDADRNLLGGTPDDDRTLGNRKGTNENGQDGRTYGGARGDKKVPTDSPGSRLWGIAGQRRQ